jgi:hypothetical protein
MDLPPLIVMGNKKQGVGSKDKVGPFQTHDASRFSFMVFIETIHFYFLSLLVLG